MLGSGSPRTDLVAGGASQADARGDRRAPSSAAPRTSCAPARRLAAAALLERGPVVLRRRRPTTSPREWSRARIRWRRSPRTRLGTCSDGRVRSRGRHHGRQLLRREDLEEGCAFEAHLLPRWDRRASDAAVHPPSRRPADRGRHRRRGAGPRRAVRLATAAPGWGAGRRRRGSRSMNLAWSALVVVAAVAVAVTAMLLVGRGAPEGSRCRRRPGIGRLRCAGDRILGPARVRRLPRLRELEGQSRSGTEEALVLAQQVETPVPWAPLRPVSSRPELVCCGRSVIHAEWPRSSRAHRATRSTWGRAVPHLPDGSARDAERGSGLRKWIDQTSDREAADRPDPRRGRVIPTPLWVVLFLISAVVFVFMLFFADRGEGAATQGS